MVKVKVISRDPETYAQDKMGHGVKIQHNTAKNLHPFQPAREYMRALNSVKMDKIFAKPFVGALSGHVDGVNVMARHPTRLNCVISGGCDGEIRIWDVAEKKTTWKVRAFNGHVRGVVVDSSGNLLLSCGDNLIKMWALKVDDMMPLEGHEDASTVLTGEHVFTSIDHRINSSTFVTSGATVQLWDHNRSKPVRTYAWGNDTVTKVKFNQVEPDILASCMVDRGIFLADSRQNTTLAKLYLKMKTNSLSWNPREAYMFSVANEDKNCYTFDMRNMNTFLLKHSDHFNAVIDIDYSPTGTEFVTGSYDKHIRIFPLEYVDIPKSREVYHTARMNRIFSVLYSSDCTFVYSGSDDTNIRMWKAEAATPLRPLHKAEREKIDYSNKLKEKYKKFPEIKKIANHRQETDEAYGAKKKRHQRVLSEKRTLDEVRERLPEDSNKRAKIMRRALPSVPILALEK